jgi:hypothetical protein
MKTTVLLLVGVGAAATALGCNNRYTILSVPAVSMTTPSLAAGTALQPAGRVEAQYCVGDDPVVSKDDNVGLIDEAIAKAQQKSGAQYISDVTISQDATCVFVEGMAMK